MVFTSDNIATAAKDIEFAHNLGVADIRIISAAQYNQPIDVSAISQQILDKHPILRYRVEHYRTGRNVRGLSAHDCSKCWLALDDMAVAGDYHYPCIIYIRQHGKPIGKLSTRIREERALWVQMHNNHTDPICNSTCLDVCVDYNNKAAATRG